MSNVRIKTVGPLFDQARREGLLKAGIKEGTRKLLPRVEAAVLAKLDASLQHPTGRYRATISSKLYDDGKGWVHSSDTRPIKTWLETGRRGDKRKGQVVEKLRKGTRAWAAGKKIASTETKAGYYEAEIARRLNG